MTQVAVYILIAIATIAIISAACGFIYRRFIKPLLIFLNYDYTDTAVNKKVVSRALKHMGCMYTWTTDEETDYCLFEFQGAKFKLAIIKNVPFVQLTMVCTTGVSLEFITLVRCLCNRITSVAQPIKMTYAVNSNTHSTDIFATSNLPVNRFNSSYLLRYIMNQMFEAQRKLLADMQTEINKARKTSCADLEAATAEWNGEISLLHELKIYKQPEAVKNHEEMGDALVTPRFLLGRLLGYDNFKVVSLSVWRDDESHALYNHPDEIADLSLSSLLITDNQFAHKWINYHLVFTLDNEGSDARNLSIHLNAEESTKNVLYYRVTFTLMPHNIRLTDTEQRTTPVKSFSFLAGHDLVPMNQQLAAITYEWNEARELSTEGNEDKLTATQRLLIQCDTPNLARLIYTGRNRYLEHRYYEAIPPLHEAYRHYINNYDKLLQRDKRNYYEVCYLIGSCYYHLHLFVIAHFYLFHALPLDNVIYNEQFVNCLVSMGDCEALNYINTALNNFERSLNAGYLNANYRNFYYFLQRRKVNLLLKINRVNEAEAMLKTMLDGNPNSDFAIDQLARIQKIKS